MLLCSNGGRSTFRKYESLLVGVYIIQGESVGVLGLHGVEVDFSVHESTSAGELA